jgi:thioredoxin-dependent peroxiredoxin
MSKLEINHQIPVFEALDQDKQLISSKTFSGSPLVVYFYPKDDTPGCTAQACAFRDAIEEFKSLDVRVVGISSDSPESHKQFAERHKLPFTLLSDTSNKIRKQFGVPKSLFGLLPGRVTYLFNSAGKLIHIFSSQLNVKQHIGEALKEMKKAEQPLSA